MHWRAAVEFPVSIIQTESRLTPFSPLRQCTFKGHPFSDKFGLVPEFGLLCCYLLPCTVAPIPSLSCLIANLKPLFVRRRFDGGGKILLAPSTKFQASSPHSTINWTNSPPRKIVAACCASHFCSIQPPFQPPFPWLKLLFSSQTPQLSLGGRMWSGLPQVTSWDILTKYIKSVCGILNDPNLSYTFCKTRQLFVFKVLFAQGRRLAKLKMFLFRRNLLSAFASHNTWTSTTQFLLPRAIPLLGKRVIKYLRKKFG